jgi:hypothetical protein
VAAVIESGGISTDTLREQIAGETAAYLPAEGR